LNKKGNFADIVEYLRVSLLITLVVVITLLFMTNWNSKVQTMPSDLVTDDVKLGSASFLSRSTTGFDYLFVFLFLAFIIFSVVAARLIPSSAKFLALSFFFFVFLIFGAMIVENVYSSFAASSSVSGVISTLTFIPFFMDNLVFFILGYAVLVAIALYSKAESGGLSL